MFHDSEEMLREWTIGNQKCLSLEAPMVWREPKDHTNVSYFCLVNTKFIAKEDKCVIYFSSILSALRHIMKGSELKETLAHRATCLTVFRLSFRFESKFRRGHLCHSPFGG